MSGLKIGVLASGSGSNLQALIDARLKDEIKSEVSCVLCNKEDAYCLTRAKKHQIPHYFIDTKKENSDKLILALFEKHQVDFVILAGYLKKISKEILAVYKGRMINIHPSLLPKYGGKGYYGLAIHKAVLASKDKETGATVHYVDEEVDTGKIILQRKTQVKAGEEASALQQRVLQEVEHPLLIEAVQKIEREGLS